MKLLNKIWPFKKGAAQHRIVITFTKTDKGLINEIKLDKEIRAVDAITALNNAKTRIASGLAKRVIGARFAKKDQRQAAFARTLKIGDL